MSHLFQFQFQFFTLNLKNSDNYYITYQLYKLRLLH